MDNLEAISPIDGRYRRLTEPLAGIFSEKGLTRYRIVVEGEHLIFLSDHPQIGTRRFSEEERSLVRGLYDVSTEDARIVKEIEVKGRGDRKATNHDLKAVEYFMKDRLGETSLKDSLELVHFGLTSEDVNSIAYGLMLSDGVGNVILPAAEGVHQDIEGLAQKYKGVPMLARTHGQPASPTTFGKEFKVFSSRLQRQLDQLSAYEILVKLNGATGNYNAQYAAYPNVDWPAFTRDFVDRFNRGRIIRLKPNMVTTQIEPQDTYAELFDNVHRLNVILIGFNQDMWRYISDDWIRQKPVEGEVGSSTMPHKVNPIDFENSEGNLGVANALLAHFSAQLPISRLQRDLSGSTVRRNFGVSLGHSLVGYRSLMKGLGKIAVNEEKVVNELESHPEVIAEAIQTILRRERMTTPYERLRDLTRGKAVTMVDIGAFIEGLDVPAGVKEELRGITPRNYTGIAQLLVETQ